MCCLSVGFFSANFNVLHDYPHCAQRLGYEYLRGLTLNFASTHQTENPRGFSEVEDNMQLLIAIVSCWLLILMMMFLFMLFQ
jgi:hypothetical protein